VNWCFWIKVTSDEGQAMAFRRLPQTHARELCDAELDREFEYMRDAGFKVDWSAIDTGAMQEIYDLNTEQFKAFGEEVRF
jgi:hypothetical protein